MPCSNPITTYTNSKYLYKGVNRWRNTFACGFCDACIKKTRAEWRLRSYFESKSCLCDGNFILFDSLTYSDDHIKHYSDIFKDIDIPDKYDYYAFSRRDVQLFFKRLRILLKRNGYNSDGKLRYILTSEYGSSEQTNGFLNTHRPHYHILFFVGFPIDPIVLSRLISRSWICGKTDGVRPYDDCSNCPVKKFCNGYCIYQSPNYVLNERVIRSDSQSNCMKCVNYVTKYISKDMCNYVNLSNRVEDFFDYYEPNWRDDYDLVKFHRKFRSQVLPFHLQSVGFGLSALEFEDLEYIDKYNKCRVPTSDKNVIQAISLPRYLERKLYYTCVRVDGRLRWLLNDRGKDVKMARLDDRIDAFKREYRMFDPNIMDDTLNGLALYNCVYRNTLCDKQSLLLPYKQYYRRLIGYHSYRKVRYINNGTFKDKFLLGKFLASGYHINDDGEILYYNKQFHKEFIPDGDMILINDRVCPFWNGFDKKLELYQKWKNNLGRSSDIIAAIDDCQVDRYKMLGLLK